MQAQTWLLVDAKERKARFKVRSNIPFEKLRNKERLGVAAPLTRGRRNLEAVRSELDNIAR